jgi:ABC-type antimicrobial peptide transport system permease subunit
VLLITGTLLGASFWRLGHVPLGFDGERVLTVEMRLLDRKYRDTTRLVAFQTELLAGIAAIPGVKEAGLTSAVPFRGVDFTATLNRPGHAIAVSGAERFVDSAYFGIMRMTLVRGRLFGRSDDPSHPRVVVVSESFARAMFGAENPLGQVIDSDSPKTIVGVVRDVRYASFGKAARPAVYFPRAQFPNGLICVVARTSLPLASAKREVARVVYSLDPLVPPMNVTTIDRIIEASTAGRRFYTVATFAFAGLALVLTITGLATIVSRSVVERRRELAIRSAVGAQPFDLVTLVTRDGVLPATIGCASGVLLVLAGSKLLRAFL